MCDTFYKKSPTKIIFAKNSDRSANEPNLCLFYPSQEIDENRKCTYINVGKVGPIHSILLVQPSWMWGGEMGINDQGVVIGNEAVFTKSKGKKEKKLLGMDLLRLALEISSSAKQAVDVIIKYLTEYGQGGIAGFDKKFYYDNSYLIADGNEAYILETAGKDWVLKQIETKGNISNALTINYDYDIGSQKRIDFAGKYTEPVFTFFSKAKERRECIAQNLINEEINVLDAIRIYRLTTLMMKSTYTQKGVLKCLYAPKFVSITQIGMIVDFHQNSNYLVNWEKVFVYLFLNLVSFGLFTICFTSPIESLDYY